MVTSVIRALVSRLLPGCQRVALVLAMLGLLPGPDGFSGQAQAAPGSEASLDNILNVIGQRQGVLSMIRI